MRKHKISLYFIFTGILLLYMYISILITIPGNITILEGQSYKTILNRFSTINVVDKSVVSTVGDDLVSQDIGKTKIKVSLFGKIPIKTINVNVVSESLIIPGGNAVGVKINTKGLTILTFEGFHNKDRVMISPFDGVDIQRGDIIIEINDIPINDVASFISSVQSSAGENTKLKILRNENNHVVYMKPEKDISDGLYKLGIWVKEVTSGIGTVTFIEPKSKAFGSLGHGINDIDGSLARIRDGKIYDAIVLSVIKGQKGRPGELKGAIKEVEELGRITKNTNCGIFGKIEKDIEIKGYNVEIALMHEVKIGPAKIISNIEGRKIEEFDIEIEKVNRQSPSSPKSMVIRVTDGELINKTGGIVQGMSGSPIIQNGKIVGAVTHVLINDPTRGYGIFIENMMKEINDIR